MKLYAPELETWFKQLEACDYSKTDALVFADWLEEHGNIAVAKALREQRHNWSNISYHGSPTYQCDWCNCGDERDDFDGPCPAAQKNIILDFKKQEEAEKAKYIRLAGEAAEFQRLQQKWGHF